MMRMHAHAHARHVQIASRQSARRAAKLASSPGALVLVLVAAPPPLPHTHMPGIIARRRPQQINTPPGRSAEEPSPTKKTPAIWSSRLLGHWSPLSV
jgi:hypothetical protein